MTDGDVPRFSLRRGARFLETFDDQPQSDDIDEAWLADLGEEQDENEATDLAGGVMSLEDGVTDLDEKLGEEAHSVGQGLDAGSAEGPGADDAPEPALNDVMTTLAERLAHLEEALARTAAACTVARVVLGQGQELLDHSAGTAGAPRCRDEAEVADLRDKAPSSPGSASTVGSTSRLGAHRHSSETPALARLVSPLRRYGSVSLRDLLRPE